MGIQNLEYPSLRKEAVFYLNLVGKLHARQATSNATEDLEYIVHYFFDDTEMAKKADQYIGVTLISQVEALAVGAFGKLLVEYLDKYAPGALPIIFQEGDTWDDLKAAAQHALISLNNSK